MLSSKCFLYVLAEIVSCKFSFSPQTCGDLLKTETFFRPAGTPTSHLLPGKEVIMPHAKPQDHPVMMMMMMMIPLTPVLLSLYYVLYHCIHVI